MVMPYSDREKQLEAQRRYYRENKEVAAQRQRDRRDIKRKYIQAAKENVPCTDCEVVYPGYIMDYDHLADKTAGLSKMYITHTLDEIKEEIAKCEIVCSNCHRHRTWMRSTGQPRL